VPRECTVCSHPESHAINEALVVERRGVRDIAGRWDLSKSAIDRHRSHIPELLVKASLAQEVADADLILEKLRGLEDEAREILQHTKDDRDWRAALSALGEIREQIKLLAQVSGRLKEIQVNNTQVNIIPLSEHPTYMAFNRAVVEALEPYPEARYALADKLGELESG
jgi:hypothetical protein